MTSHLLRTGQLVGGSTGLAVLGTVAWTVVANSVHTQAARTAAIAARAGHPIRPDGQQLAAAYHHALATGFARGFLTAAAIALLALLIAFATIRVRRQDLTGARPAPDQGAASQPAVVPHDEDRAALAAAVRPCRHC